MEEQTNLENNSVPEVESDIKKPVRKHHLHVLLPLILLIIFLGGSGVSAYFLTARYKGSSNNPPPSVTLTPAITSIPLVISASPSGTVIHNTSPTETVINGPGTGSICGQVQYANNGNAGATVSVTVKTLDGKTIGTTKTDASGGFTMTAPTGKLVIYSVDNQWFSSTDQVVVPQGVCQKVFIQLQSQLDSGMGR